VTGVAALTIELDAKRLELLRELAPGARNIGALVNPNRPDIDAQLSGMQTAAQSVGRPLVILKTGTERELDAVFVNQSDRKFDALLVGADPFFLSRRAQTLELLIRHAMPAIFAQREFVLAGGLISYGASLADAYRQTGVYAGRILKGEKPADLPGRAADQVRTGDQPQDGQGAWAHDPTVDPPARRRGDRVSVVLSTRMLRLLRSQSGTNRAFIGDATFAAALWG
jgi:ABC-type uncharacterized transport system substrate-binding protein